MKHLFYLSLFLLCVACSVEDVSLIPEETAGSETRSGGSITFSLTDNQISVSWSEPFGGDVGFTAEVYNRMDLNETMASFSSSQDSGTQYTYIYNPFEDPLWSLNLIARVRANPYNGYISQEIWVPVENNNTPGNDPNNPGQGGASCNHQFVDVGLYSEIWFADEDYGGGTMMINRNMRNPGMIYAEFTIPQLVGYNPGSGSPIYEYPKSMAHGYFSSHLENQSSGDQTAIVHTALYAYEIDPYEWVRCEVRVYDASCSKVSGGLSTFPTCNHYFKCTFTISPSQGIIGGYGMSYPYWTEVHE